jgi:hypothetical protein
VTSIGEGAFFGCAAFKEITLPEGITEISAWAFGLNLNINSVTIPSSVYLINDIAFGLCTLTNVTFPEKTAIKLIIEAK